MRWDLKASPGANAAHQLPKMARKYLAAGEVAAKSKSTWEQLHEFRLISKRFRYTLEVFRPFYGHGMDRRLAAMKRVQNVLGEINDCETTLAIALVAAEPAFADWLRRRRERRLKVFRKVWAEEFGSHQAARRWVRYLGTPRDGV